MVEAHQSEWLSLSEACELLEAHRSTVRRWADEGKIPCVRTPGGHRRFPRRELVQYLEAQRSRATVPRLVLAPGEHPGFSRELAARETWHQSFQEANLVKRARALGQRLLGLMLQYISRLNDDDRFLQEAELLGAAMGRDAVRGQVPLADMVQAFVFCRRTVSELVLHGPAQYEPGDSIETRRLHWRVDRFMDAALMGAIDEYEAHYEARLSEARGGAGTNP